MPTQGSGSERLDTIRSSFGDVVCRLDSVMLVAQRRYHLLPDQVMKRVAQITDIDQRVLHALMLNQKDMYDMRVLARLCYVFGSISLGSLLEYLPPPLHLQETPAQITLPKITIVDHLPENYGKIVCLLRQNLDERRQEWLQRIGNRRKRHVSYADLEGLLGVKMDTLQLWARRDLSRYDRTSMAQICHALGITVGELFYYLPPGVDSPPPSLHDGRTS